MVSLSLTVDLRNVGRKCVQDIVCLIRDRYNCNECMDVMDLNRLLTDCQILEALFKHEQIDEEKTKLLIEKMENNGPHF